MAQYTYKYYNKLNVPHIILMFSKNFQQSLEWIRTLRMLYRDFDLLVTVFYSL